MSGEKINLSNSVGIDSERPEISAAGSNVYVTWWERNATSNEPVLRVSNDSNVHFLCHLHLNQKLSFCSKSLRSVTKICNLFYPDGEACGGGGRGACAPLVIFDELKCCSIIRKEPSI
jgi:hypothetical protein